MLKAQTVSSTPKMNLREEAYQRFMDALLARKFRPGRMWSQRQIAEITDCSLSAVREALKRLEGDGVVELIRQKGVFLREISKKEISNAYELRNLVELHAIDAYTVQTSVETIDRFRHATKRIVQKLANGQTSSFLDRVELDHALHRDIVAALDNELISRMHQKIETTTLLARLSLPAQFQTAGSAFHEHLTLLDAIKARDVGGARKALKEHLHNARERAVAAAEF